MEIMNEFTVTEEDIDLFHHMNYKRYIEFFEKERAHWFETSGFSFQQMAERDIATVLLKLNTEYIKEARLGDKVIVKTSLGRLGTKSFTMEQTMYSNQNEEISTSHSIFAMFDLIQRKSIPVVDELVQFFPVKQK